MATVATWRRLGIGIIHNDMKCKKNTKKTTATTATTTMIQAIRTREPIRHALGGGLGCKGSVRETGPCPRSSPQDCVLSEWASWGECSRTCGGGTQFRVKEVVREASEGGRPCNGDLHQVESCAEMPCNADLDCFVSQWSFWSPCSVSCGKGQRVRQRAVLQAAQRGGAGCNLDLLQAEGCEGKHTSPTCGDHVDCKWSSWKEWSQCYKAENCGLGHRSRERVIEVEPRGHGALCDPLPREEVVPDVTCAKSCTKAETCINGEWGSWAIWGTCSVSCGHGGTRTRHRIEIVKHNHCGRHAEGSNQQFASCSADAVCEDQLDKEDCRWAEWTDWTTCSSNCNGIQERNRIVASYAAYGGSPCVGPVSETQRCNPGPANWVAAPNCESGVPVDCEQTGWQEWGSCSATCGTGHQTRFRQITQAPIDGGKSCDNPMTEIRQCQAANHCPITDRDCVWDEWEDWTSCNTVLGQTQRIRKIRVSQAGFGQDCAGANKELAKCERSCEDHTYYCSWDKWEQWGACSEQCGPRGRRSRTRSLMLTKELPAVHAAQVADISSAQAKFELASGTAEFDADELRLRMEAAQNGRLKDLSLAFFAGFACVAVLMGSISMASRRFGASPRIEARDASPRDMSRSLTQAAVAGSGDIELQQ
eukprot:TRINITY_DN36854_c0_g1_i1.p1 TRINITY_DN36854_c0_g1~~TRINITY_DN36854_c0_g1_i1.p1  ORF type:complete len:648 (+),score=94.54 TRINITY_DN36854_c0_g1_i1:65-2008(+)